MYTNVNLNELTNAKNLMNDEKFQIKNLKFANDENNKFDNETYKYVSIKNDQKMICYYAFDAFEFLQLTFDFVNAFYVNEQNEITHVCLSNLRFIDIQRLTNDSRDMLNEYFNYAKIEMYETNKTTFKNIMCEHDFDDLYDNSRIRNIKYKTHIEQHNMFCYKQQIYCYNNVSNNMLYLMQYLTRYNIDFKMFDIHHYSFDESNIYIQYMYDCMIECDDISKTFDEITFDELLICASLLHTF